MKQTTFASPAWKSKGKVTPRERLATDQHPGIDKCRFFGMLNERRRA